MFTTMLDVPRTAVEGTMLAGCRTVFGNERVAEAVFDLPYDEGFVRRHSTQLGSLLNAHLEELD